LVFIDHGKTLNYLVKKGRTKQYSLILPNLESAERAGLFRGLPADSMIPGGEARSKRCPFATLSFIFVSALLPEQAPQRSKTKMPRLKGGDIYLICGELATTFEPFH